MMIGAIVWGPADTLIAAAGFGVAALVWLARISRNAQMPESEKARRWAEAHMSEDERARRWVEQQLAACDEAEDRRDQEKGQ